MRKVFKYLGVAIMLIGMIALIISIIFMTDSRINFRQYGVTLSAVSALIIFISFIILDTTW